MREINCFIHWIEIYPLGRVMQQQGPVFLYNRADFTSMVALIALVPCYYYFLERRARLARGGGVWTTINRNASVVPIVSY